MNQILIVPASRYCLRHEPKQRLLVTKNNYLFSFTINFTGSLDFILCKYKCYCFICTFQQAVMKKKSLNKIVKTPIKFVCLCFWCTKNI